MPGNSLNPCIRWTTLLLDVLVVPGGYAGTIPGLKNPAWQNYIKKVCPDLRYLFTVCTGAGSVARSGVLSGRKATTNKALKHRLIKRRVVLRLSLLVQSIRENSVAVLMHVAQC